MEGHSLRQKRARALGVPRGSLGEAGRSPFWSLASPLEGRPVCFHDGSELSALAFPGFNQTIYLAEKEVWVGGGMGEPAAEPGAVIWD